MVINLDPINTPISILAEGYFDTRHAKTATGVIRYGDWIIHSIIDSKLAGKQVSDIYDLDCDAPIYASLDQACQANKPQALLLGIAPVGGGIPDEWLEIVKQAIVNGIHIINGLHIFLNDNVDLRTLAEVHHVNIWDVRDPSIYPASANPSVAKQASRPQATKVVAMVGSDCSVGKMCAALELDLAMRAQGLKSSFIATGQTGIMITSGHGIPLDRIISDFAAGAVEAAIQETITQNSPQYILVEGQGSLLHPGYSGVTMSLLHGSNPDAMILCHKPDITHIMGGYDVKIPSLSQLIAIYEEAISWTQGHAKVEGICLNTSNYDDSEAQTIIQAANQETGLSVTDPVRYGVKELVDALKL